MALEGRTDELESEQERIKLEMLGKTRKRQSDHKLYYKAQENTSVGEVGILIHRKLTDRVKLIKVISERVVYAIIQINRLETLTISEAYAPISTTDDEVSKLYEDVSGRMPANKTSKV
ncbi:uncharacterized protein LOC125504565 [Dendroctonus ponderosae]|uniref:uncharacterized protein LOC125504565 n=1 Tax=Dendroctonus ponderosae TaxID=77166 RepID=UPI002034D014|nr:uncharacterized protein LOC125504565 [Dendroctonus ponderosae]